MGLRRWAAAMTVSVVVTGVAGCSLAGVGAAPTAAERSIAQIRIFGYQKAGESDDAGPGTTTSSAVYVGPSISDGRLARIMNGQGVSLNIFPRPSPNVAVLPSDNTIWIGKGYAPMNCGLLMYRYRDGKPPSKWWDLTGHELAQARMRKVSIFEVTVVCGKG